MILNTVGVTSRRTRRHFPSPAVDRVSLCTFYKCAVTLQGSVGERRESQGRGCPPKDVSLPNHSIFGAVSRLTFVLRVCV